MFWVIPLGFAMRNPTDEFILRNFSEISRRLLSFVSLLNLRLPDRRADPVSRRYDQDEPDFFAFSRSISCFKASI